MRRFIFYSLILTLLAAAGCTNKIIKSPAAEDLLLFPAPPDTARIQFLTYINTSADIEKPPSRIKSFFLGKEEPKPIVRPYGVAVKDDRIYICDPEIRGLEIMNLKERSFQYFQPTGKGELRMPLNCFVDDQNTLYVADSYRKQVVIFDQQGKYQGELGDTGRFKPIAVSVYRNRIFVTNLDGHAVVVFDKNSRKRVGSFPDRRKGEEGFLYKPTSIAVAENEIYVTDFGEAKIKVYNIAGSYLRSIGSYGKSPGQFVRPKGIALDRNNNLYVVDAAFENVQIFDRRGRMLTYLGRPGNMSLPAGVGIVYNNLDAFRDYLYQDFSLKFLIFVTNQFGSNKIGVYGFVEQKKPNENPEP